MSPEVHDLWMAQTGLLFYIYTIGAEEVLAFTLQDPHPHPTPHRFNRFGESLPRGGGLPNLTERVGSINRPSAPSHLTLKIGETYSDGNGHHYYIDRNPVGPVYSGEPLNRPGLRRFWYQDGTAVVPYIPLDVSGLVCRTSNLVTKIHNLTHFDREDAAAVLNHTAPIRDVLPKPTVTPIGGYGVLLSEKLETLVISHEAALAVKGFPSIRLTRGALYTLKITYGRWLDCYRGLRILNGEITSPPSKEDEWVSFDDMVRDFAIINNHDGISSKDITRIFNILGYEVEELSLDCKLGEDHLVLQNRVSGDRHVIRLGDFESSVT